MLKLDNKKINQYIGIFFLVQPILDLITSLSVKFFDTNFSLGMVVRFIFLLFSLVYLVFLSTSQKKKISLLLVAIMIAYIFMYLANNVYLKGTGILFDEIKYMLKLFYFPFILLSFWNLIDEEWFSFRDSILVEITFIYSIIMLLAQLTGTQFISYSHNKVGHSGWFFSPNEIGAVIAILLPVVFVYVIENRKKIGIYSLLFAYIYSIFILGTKVPFLALITSIISFIIFYIVNMIIEKKSYLKIIALPLVISIIGTMIILPNTPVGMNLNIHLSFLELNSVSDLYKSENKDKLTNFVFSSRDIYLNETRELYQNSNVKEKILGMGYSQVDGKTPKIIEIDYYDIFYRNGVLGFCVYFAPLLLACLNIIRLMLKKICKVITNIEVVKYVLGIFLALGIAYFAGHVFLAPAVSIYVIILLVKLEKEIERIQL